MGRSQGILVEIIGPWADIVECLLMAEGMASFHILFCFKLRKAYVHNNITLHGAYLYAHVHLHKYSFV